MTDVADGRSLGGSLSERAHAGGTDAGPARPAGDHPDDEVRTPLDEWLAVQADLSAVERFSRADDAGLAGRGTGTWHDVVPLARPGPDERYAFEVDLDSCTGCKACVAACNSLNGLDPGESFRTVGVLVGLDRGGAALQQTVTSACHHCADPACLTGCPVDAYEVDVSTGIVAHLDDQCIGCGYCTLTCPYEVPRMNERLGIVRKCDLCRGRLTEGEAPACAQACPTGAIAVRVVDRADAAPTETDGAVATVRLVPGAPASALTRPSTLYRSRRPLPATMVATDAASAPIAHGHPALAVMLVLTQVAVGALVVEQGVVVLAPDDAAALEPWGPLLGLGTGVLALGASVLHLGRPRYALRAVIGFRHSWLSREIVAFGAFAGLAALNAGVALLNAEANVATGALRAATVLAGIAGIACSVLLYAVTGRQWWRVAVTGPKFALTGAVGGVAAVLAVAAIVDPEPLATPVAALLAAATAVKLATEATFLRHRGGDPALSRTRSARLLTGALGGVTAWRFALGALGGLVLPLMVVACLRSDPVPRLAVALLGVAALLLVVVGELLERLTFFTASVAPRMPGSRP